MRRKKTPVRRRHLEENDGEEVVSEILGQVQLRNSDSLLANEIASDIDGKEKRENNNTTTSIASSTTITTSSSNNDIEHARERNIKKTTNKKLTRSSSRKVHFATSLDSEIPPPELIIERRYSNSKSNNNSNSNDNEGDYLYRLLRFCPRKNCSIILPLQGDNDRTILSSFNLTKTKIIMEGMISETNFFHHLVVTGIAIRELWKEYNLSNQFQFLTSLIKCVEEDSIQLVLNSPNEDYISPSLNIILTQHAFETCRDLPLIQQHRQHKKFDAANCLQHVIKGLFGIVKGAPIYSNDKSTDEISARMVYNLVDNKQIERFSNKVDDDDDKNNFPTLNIKGLLPTLRPYQAAAVEWMIEREHLTTHGEEWKVMWSMLDSTTRRIIPLIQLNVNQNSENLGPLYCPFNGRIARTVREAKKITLGGKNDPIRGGILAEQMGLGKSIEVLALILANPNSKINETSITRPAACRQELISVDESSMNNKQSRGKNGSRRNMGVDSDRLELGDTNDLIKDEVYPRIFSNGTVPVKPDTREEQVRQRWIDGIEVGSCICGDLICFSKKTQKTKIVFCELCEEPMHLECTCLELVDANKLPKLDLRRTFGNERLRCVLCKDCPCCLARRGNTQPIKSRATIIICPPSILDQWEQEIKRHTKQMKVLIYDGVEKVCKNSRNRAGAMRLLHPAYMANADIILVSFVALMSDLSHSEENRFAFQSEDDNWSKSLRKRKKYRVVPSPLLSIHFWRVCIDEAQRVEVTTTKVAKMALKLKAEYLWAVSGTPIGHGKLQDLYGLFLFLGLAPFDNREWFNSCLSSTIEGVDDRIQLILCKIFWRSTKGLETVKDQVGLPEMRDEQIVLNFSSIERHFYDRQLEMTIQLASNFKDIEIAGEGNKRKSAGLDYLSENLHRLRAACCHPQVGANGIGVKRGKFKKSRCLPSRSDEYGNSVASRVMTMEQILDRLIDDARKKCEEVQRLVILHTNGMAGLSRLKIEARGRGVAVDQDDRSLLLKSGHKYRESILLAQTNAIATKANAEATLTGSTGFCFPNQIFRDGKCMLKWKMKQDFVKIWSKIEYESSSRKLIKLRIRPIVQLPADIREENSNDFKWHLVVPTSVVLQVATTSTGGEFVDCAERSLEINDWVDIGNVRRTNKSKTWRIVVQKSNCCDQKSPPSPSSSSIQSCGYFVGLEIELYEPQINSDDLQLLHALHNACISYEAAIQIPPDASETESNDEIMRHIESMKKEMIQIESLHKVQSQTLHNACMKKLDELTKNRNEKEQQLYDKTYLINSSKKVDDCWDDGWLDDFLGIVCLYGSQNQKNVIFGRIVQDLEVFNNTVDTRKFPEFNDLAGLKIALSMRLSEIRGDGIGNKHEMLPATTADNRFVQIRSTRFKCDNGEHRLCIDSIRNLSSDPDLIELDENRICRLCKSDWNQTGKICRHCEIAAQLQDLKPDSVTITVVNAIHASIRSPAGMALLNSTHTSHIAQRAKLFFEVLEAEEREKIGAWRMWRAHLDLLNGIDELVSCKQSIRLSLENEDLTLYTEEQLNAIVQPIGLLSQYHVHDARQTTCLGELKRSSGTLRYLQNQRRSMNNGEETTPTDCLICLRPLDGECSVLRCGHRFHQVPCLDQMLKNSNGLNVHCPMKCRLNTAKNEVMIATNKARNDGSNVIRKINGSYGTKISRIVSDILSVRDKGEKGVVFSQWNDMLAILESALIENNVTIARPYGGSRFSESLRSFQSPNCTVLLLNLKQGAEGLTLVQATHVFMVEPVMNNALYQQAINRIYRIGQNKKTFVWRYLMQDTIEMKLDKMRLKQDGNNVLEDSNTKRNFSFALGGIDGVFSSQEELLATLDRKLSRQE